ncbi:Receptor-like protein EIX2 [Linum perenne]
MQSFRTNLSLTILLLFSFLSLPLGDSRCTKTDIEALLTFKNGLVDPSGRLSSWKGDDCCKWVGVKCSNGSTVTELSLRNPYPSMNAGNIDQEAYKASCLKGNISSSLLQLPNLSYFDMSLNDFEGGKIPEFLGGMKSLRYLNLSYSLFGGEIPSQLGSLSNLQVLDLYADSFAGNGPVELRATNLGWLSALSMLKHLNLGSVRIVNSGGDWLTAVNMLPSLVELHLHYCQLQVLPQSLPVINFTSLSVLDLSDNSFNSPIPPWLFKLTSLRELYLRWDFLSGPVPSELSLLKSLEVLDLSNNLEFGGQVSGVFGSLTKLKRLDLSANNLKGGIHDFLQGFADNPTGNSLMFLDMSSNSLEGEIPDTLGVLQKLQTLDLSRNGFRGSIPNSIGKMSSLKQLDLSFNSMDGSIPESFGQLSELVDVNLLANSWGGVVRQAHLVNLRSLKTIRLATTDTNRSLIFDVPSKWVPPFKLTSIQLENCLIGPSFPTWLRIQNQLTSISLRNVGISDTVPSEWFSSLPSELTFLVISNNQITGKLPSNLKFPRLSTIDLSSNMFEGGLPIWSTNASVVYLQDNKFTGSIPENIDKLMPRLQKLYLSQNDLTGKIPSSMCDLHDLQILSLRNNLFSGQLPDSWHSFMLWAIDVSNNSITGNIPTSFGSLPSLSILLLSSNQLVGEIPASLQNRTGLTSMDLGNNRLTGILPSWLGQEFQSLFMLNLNSNAFTGPIPPLCSLPNLHILDISGNKFSGAVPKCLGNLTAMVSGKSGEVFQQLLTVAMKGRKVELDSILANINAINLSGNNLTGDIPGEITNLSALRILNLSRNQFSGKITENIGKLQHLEALDLSHNHVTGTIPQSLGSIVSLVHLNLSYNSLEGRIPTGLQKFKDPSVFYGNPSLCGSPLPPCSKAN